jgi:chromosome segregation ATPase
MSDQTEDMLMQIRRGGIVPRLEATIETLREQLAASKAEHAALQQRVKEIGAEHEATKLHLAAYKESVLNCAARVAALHAENQRLREALEKALDRIGVDDVEWAKQALSTGPRD